MPKADQNPKERSPSRIIWVVPRSRLGRDQATERHVTRRLRLMWDGGYWFHFSDAILSYLYRVDAE